MIHARYDNPRLSLVIPLRDEEHSVRALLDSIYFQTFMPDEIVLVDGGSTDGTIVAIEKWIRDRESNRNNDGDASGRGSIISLIISKNAPPGKGRNIGIEAARNEWIALTDAGIELDANWLEELVTAARQFRQRCSDNIQTATSSEKCDGWADIVYGNYAPVVNRLFEKCAAIAYVPAQGPDSVRGKSIASCLLRKQVWKEVGGFPNYRASEDLVFMDSVKAANFKEAFAPKALVRWQLRPGVGSTFSKFVLYSKHNVWAGRQWDWHHGVLRQYALILPFLLLALFWGSLWLVAVPFWLVARSIKRIYTHRFEFGTGILVDPFVVAGVMLLVLIIDVATFVGWLQAIITKNKTDE